MLHRRLAILAVAAVVALAAAGCGVTSDAVQATSSSAPPSSVPRDGTSTTAPEGTSTTVSPDTTEGTTTRPGGSRPGTTVAGPDGAVFTDPQHDYRMKIDPSWIRQTAASNGDVELWFVGAASDDFRPNLNILTQNVGDMSLTDYLDIGVQGNGSLGQVTLVSSKVFTLDDGHEAGRLEYSAHPGDYILHFLAIVVISSGRAVLVTLTTAQDAYAGIAPKVEPYMRTLVPIG